MNTEVISNRILIHSEASLFSFSYLKEVWQHRELLYFLTWRDLRARYKQACLGIAWVIIQPLSTILVFTVFFGKLVGVSSDGVPYPVFSFAAMLPWAYFASAMNRGSQSIVNSSHLINKVYFPRITIPLAAVLAGLVDYLITGVIFFVVLAFYGYYPRWDWLVYLPILTFMVMVLGFGTSLFLGALNVKYRDISHALPFLTQLWMFATPIVYPLTVIPDRYRWLASLNPMTGIVEGFRTLLLGRPMDVLSLSLGSASIMGMLLIGLFYFLNQEQNFPDLI